MSELGAPSVTPGRYRHFKGQYYQVTTLARHSETEEIFVVYQALYGERGIWIRPLEHFTSAVEVDGRKTPRFSRCEEPNT